MAPINVKSALSVIQKRLQVRNIDFAKTYKVPMGSSYIFKWLCETVSPLEVFSSTA